MIPDAVLVVAFGWSALLLVAGGLLLLRARDSLHRLLRNNRGEACRPQRSGNALRAR